MDDHAGDRIRIRNRQVLSDNWFRLENVTFDQVRDDGSRQTLQREVYHNGPGAAVLPMDAARGTVLLVRQLRIPACLNGDNPMLVELCAGMIEAGNDPAETVRKEAEQELGYRLRDLRQVFVLYMSPGSSAEKLHLFAAAYRPDDRIGTGGGLAREGERIECLELPLARAWEMVAAGEIVDAKTVLMLQHVRLNSQ
jgi:GDP-mannose pyrophosphatase NudK